MQTPSLGVFRPGELLAAKQSVVSSPLSWIAKASSASTANDWIVSSGENVVVDVLIAPDDQLAVRPLLSQLGFMETASYGAIMSGSMPIAALDGLDAIELIRGVAPASQQPRRHEVFSQGDEALGVDRAREEFDVDASGVTVGIVSDSFESGTNPGSLRADLSEGELPSSTRVLFDDPVGGDEGRAIAQIVHDLAPGAAITFHSGSFGQASFAQAILDLANDGADVIVDDLIYLREPMFMDGVVAQAITQVDGRGVSYHSAAGNQADQSYEAAFDGVAVDVELDGLEFQTLHDFDIGPGVDLAQSVRIPQGETITLSLQWDEPFFSATEGRQGARSDVDVFLLDDQGDVVAASVDANIGGDAVEVIVFTNQSANSEFDLVIGLFDGQAPNIIKYVEFGGEVEFLEHLTRSGTAIGHPSTDAALSIGAAFYQDTPAFGTDPARLEDFSANGDGPALLFDTEGNRLVTPQTRQSVDLVGPDGVDTSFFGSFDVENNGLPNFFGTSAAAPHIAAVAALALERNPHLLPEDIQELLRSTALDMDDPFTAGFDVGTDPSTGAGLVDAQAALAAADSYDRRTIAEFGRIDGLSSERQTILLENEFLDPVVIATPPGRAGSDPGAIRIASVRSDRFDVLFDEPNYQDGDHVPEPLSYLVVEAGRWELPDGAVIEAGTLQSDLLTPQGFEQVDFAEDFADRPVVLSQIQTLRGGDYAVTRMRDVDKGGFEIAMQEEEARNNGQHVTERLGYVALDEGVHGFRGIDFEAGSQSGIDSDGGTLRFDDVFADDDPLLFASIASFHGRNPATLRLEALDGEQANVVVEEERSANFETDHGREIIDFLVVDGPGRIVIEDTSTVLI